LYDARVDFSSVDAELANAIEQGVFPGAAVIVKQAGRVLYRHACGFRRLEPDRAPLDIETIFDVASLTKPLATTLAVLLCITEHSIHFEDPVSRFLPDFQGPGKERITIRHLLSHASGLPAWRPYFQSIREQEKSPGTETFLVLGTRHAREWVYTQIQHDPLEATPGERAVYTDLGFILLGAIVERLSATTLDAYCQQRIFQPLALHHTAFLNQESHSQGIFARPDHIAATERCPWRKRVICGEVHDDNAYAMGGVAGHAGVFSTVDDVDRLVSCLVDCYHGKHDFVPPALLQQCWIRDGQVPGSTWALGWDTPSPQQSSAGELFSAHSVGHLGFTGTSVWIDLERQVHVILLTNRVHPSRDNTAIRDFRPRFHNAVMKVVLGRGD
jgi:CubicO group peptidase (beta-lactamase class C family)